MTPCTFPQTEIFQTSYESGIKELSQEFRVRLQEELTQREAVEKQLEKQVGKQQTEEDHNYGF